MISFGSVCSGIEAASVAWGPLGWKAAWLSEIEKFPCAVLAHHYPDVPNLGDMTTLPDRIRSGEVVAPDVFCGGTPCQAFSVAGLRKSLDDARGNLSLTFCEIADAIDQVRLIQQSNPSIVFWENVPGVLNTKDNAFGCFLGALAGEDDALVPPGGRWTNAGFIDGPQRAVAWRVLDAQYFGVAQRRRRVFVIASARDDFDPAAVLFEFEGLRRDSAPSRKAREGAAPSIGTGAPFSRTGNDRVETDAMVVVGSLCARTGQSNSVQDAEQGHLQSIGVDIFNGAFTGDTAASLTKRADGTGTGPSVMQPIALAENTIGRKPENGGNGDGFTEEGPMYTLNATGVHGVAQPIPLNSMNCFRSPDADASTGCGIGEAGEAMFTITKANSHAVAQPVGAFKPGQSASAHSIGYEQEMAPTLEAGEGGNNKPAVHVGMAVRRLTPKECERLQGFPDNYTKIADKTPDGPRYKALGNSWAVPVVRWIGERIARAT